MSGIRDRLGRFGRAAEPAPEPGPDAAGAAAERLARAEDGIRSWSLEQSRLAGELDGFLTRRADLVGDEDRPVAEIVEAEEWAKLVRLETERHEKRRDPLYTEWNTARAAVAQERWRQLIPDLERAMHACAAAFRAANEAADRYRALHGQAEQQGYHNELRGQFIAPPTPQINPWVYATFVAAVEQRAGVQPTAPAVEVWLEVEADAPHVQRFTPRRVDPYEVQQIGSLAEPRRVHILFGPVRTSNLNIGFARLHPGETPTISARAAFSWSHPAAPNILM